MNLGYRIFIKARGTTSEKSLEAFGRELAGATLTASHAHGPSGGLRRRDLHLRCQNSSCLSHVRPLSLFYSDASADGVEERSLAPRSRSHARLRRNATMSHAFSIKQCTEVTMQDLISTHHEMAHIQYYLQYSEQPQLFRDGANPAFHEAVANAATLSVYNLPHLQRIGLYNNRSHDSYEVGMNFLMSMALEKVAYLPFAFMVDQGVVPPIARTEADFDPGSKYHIISDQEYVKYYLATVLEFQIFEQLCAAAGHAGHLHDCDVYRSRDAGRLLSEIMQSGASKPAPEVIRALTRGKTNRVSPEALVKYFRLLELWLRVQNRDEAVIGWHSDTGDVAMFAPRTGAAPRHAITNTLLITLFLICVI
ncbi:Angiotensin-converting enzyme [Eumeta japonica]|uniref:Angiotensin-converting enzyme n=1 Tax=Eumeta variegata TaxID=151549 RepID=A0A4C1V7N7_EUMVA|nr:Angiotensin-converting enzyme [Eumeta japonica]